MISEAMLAQTILEYFRIHHKEFEDFVIDTWKDKGQSIDDWSVIDWSESGNANNALTIRIAKESQGGEGYCSERVFGVTIHKQNI